MPPLVPNDAELVAQSLSGSRDAFGGIVSRYQSLISSLAYSATGNLGQSEDLAQETFVTAWRQLRDLREPEKLRPWLCGIARNLSNHWLRRQEREPLRAAESLETADESPAPGLQPHDQTISKEEQAILWRSLEQIPELYREPLVLFYRENQSVEAVARNMELSEDAVKQRLSRGRKMLAEEVTAFVEGALRLSAPGRGFVFGVLAALPVLTASASAATVAATASEAKASATLGLSGMLLGPLVGILSAWFAIKAGLAGTSSMKERQLVIRFVWMMVGLVIASLFGMGVIVMNLQGVNPIGPSLAASLLIGFSLMYCITLMGLILRFNRLHYRLRMEGAVNPAAVPSSSDPSAIRQSFEYRSSWKLFGLPLVHIRLGRRPNEKLQPVVGWIAVGDFAVGVLFAAGAFAIGGFSMGAASLGLISLGGVAVGGVALGGIAIGAGAVGGVAIGYLAVGGCAMAWQGAVGGVAVSQHVAVGGLAQAQHANDTVAKAFFQTDPFIRHALQWVQYSRWLMLLWLPVVGVGLWLAIRFRNQRGKVGS
jgi:RNA polymerase sigma factor (sigma-70 family)